MQVELKKGELRYLIQLISDDVNYNHDSASWILADGLIAYLRSCKEE